MSAIASVIDALSQLVTFVLMQREADRSILFDTTGAQIR